MIRVGVAALVLIGAAGVAETPRPVLSAEQAIGAADASRNGVHGRFQITVKAGGKRRGATYLNSMPDYRSPGVLTFRLAPNVADVLQRRYGGPPERVLVGKRITVEGIVRRQMIVNTNYGRVQGFNRWTHEVYLRLPGQVIAVE